MIASDGTDQLYLYHPSTLVLTSKINVWYTNQAQGASGDRTPLTMMNELEYVGGNVVLANLFYPQYFLIWGISLLTGYAAPVANLTLAAIDNGCPAADYDHVMNGIAVESISAVNGGDNGGGGRSRRSGNISSAASSLFSAPPASLTQKLYVTGKYWGKVLVVSIDHNRLQELLHHGGGR